MPATDAARAGARAADGANRSKCRRFCGSRWTDHGAVAPQRGAGVTPPANPGRFGPRGREPMVRLLSLLILLLLPNPFASHDATRDVRQGQPAPAVPHVVAPPAVPSHAAPARVAAPAADGEVKLARGESGHASPDSTVNHAGDSPPEPPLI